MGVETRKGLIVAYIGFAHVDKSKHKGYGQKQGYGQSMPRNIGCVFCA